MSIDSNPLIKCKELLAGFADEGTRSSEFYGTLMVAL